MIDGSFNWADDFVKVFEHWTVWVAIASAVILGGLKGFKKIKRNLLEDNYLTIHSEIHELITELRILTDSARAQVMQFHNGEYFMDGISMRKFSLTHESVAKGFAVDRIQGYLCSIFLPLLQSIVEADPKIRYTSDLKDGYFKQYLESKDVEAFTVYPIRTNNQITGFIMNQWCNSKKVEGLNQESAKRETIKIANNISVQLSFQKN